METAHRSVAASHATGSGPQRLVHLDRLRTALVALVVVHHTAVAYGAPGSWYSVIAPPPGSVAPLVLALLVAVDQSFFMALLFAIAGYFTPSSCERKGACRYVRDRLVRLGIPLALYLVLLEPSLRYLAARLRGNTDTGWLRFLVERFPADCGTGPLWFVATLLLFQFGYLGFRIGRAVWQRSPFAAHLLGPGGQRVTHLQDTAGGSRPEGTRSLPSSPRIAAFAVAVGLGAFLLRLRFPVGVTVLDLQLAYYPLYVSFFAFGVWARRAGWLEALTPERARPWFRGALVLIAAAPLFLAASGGSDRGLGAFNGGANVFALAYALWEPWLCIGISLGLLVFFRRRFSSPSRFASALGRSSYAAYVVHPFLVVPVTHAVARLAFPVLVRFVLAAALAVPSTFAVAALVRRLPLARRVF